LLYSNACEVVSWELGRICQEVKNNIERRLLVPSQSFDVAEYAAHMQFIVASGQFSSHQLIKVDFYVKNQYKEIQSLFFSKCEKKVASVKRDLTLLSNANFSVDLECLNVSNSTLKLLHQFKFDQPDTNLTHIPTEVWNVFNDLQGLVNKMISELMSKVREAVSQGKQNMLHTLNFSEIRNWLDAISKFFEFFENSEVRGHRELDFTNLVVHLNDLLDQYTTALQKVFKSTNTFNEETANNFKCIISNWNEAESFLQGVRLIKLAGKEQVTRDAQDYLDRLMQSVHAIGLNGSTTQLADTVCAIKFVGCTFPMLNLVALQEEAHKLFSRKVAEKLTNLQSLLSKENCFDDSSVLYGAMSCLDILKKCPISQLMEEVDSFEAQVVCLPRKFQMFFVHRLLEIRSKIQSKEALNGQEVEEVVCTLETLERMRNFGNDFLSKFNNDDFKSSKTGENCLFLFIEGPQQILQSWCGVGGIIPLRFGVDLESFNSAKSSGELVKIMENIQELVKFDCWLDNVTGEILNFEYLCVAIKNKIELLGEQTRDFQV